MKKFTTIWISCLSLALVGCQGGASEEIGVDLSVDALRAQSGQPYGCKIRSVALTKLQGEKEFVEMKLGGTVLFLDEQTHSQFLFESVSEIPIGEWFVSQADGVVHSFFEGNHEIEAHWSCETTPADFLPLGPLSIYPSSDIHLSGQSLSLISEFPTFVVITEGERVDFLWSPVPAKLKETLSRQYELPGWYGGVNIESVSLAVDLENGFPMSFQITLQDGKTIDTRYQYFKLSREDYFKQAEVLRSSMRTIEPDKCNCDGGS